MVLVLGILFTATLTALSLTIKRYSRINVNQLPISQELHKPSVFKRYCHHRIFHYSKSFSNAYFFKSNRRHYYSNNLRLYSVFEWVKKFEQEELLIQDARKAIHQAGLAALRFTLLKAAVIFQELKQCSKSHPLPPTYGNKNFLHLGLVHHLAQP